MRNLKKEGNASKLAVCVGTVTNDLRFLSNSSHFHDCFATEVLDLACELCPLRIFDVPKMTLCALRVTEKARERILKAGGSRGLRAPDNAI